MGNAVTRCAYRLALLAFLSCNGCGPDTDHVNGGGDVMELRTDRLVLRGFTPDDWRDVHELAMDWSQAPGPDFDKWPTAEEAAGGLTGHFSSSPKYFALCLKETRKVVGLVALNGHETDGRFDLGHVIHSDYQDNDIDREALQAMVDHVFLTEKPTSIITHNDPTHREQLAPLVALGFSPAGEAEQGTLVLARAEWERRRVQ